MDFVKTNSIKGHITENLKKEEKEETKGEKEISINSECDSGNACRL